MKNLWALLLLLLTPLTQAQTTILDGMRTGTINALEFFNRLIFDLQTFDEFFLAKTMIAIIIFVTIHFVLTKSKLLGEKRGLIFIITTAVTILSMRGIPQNEFITGILLPYGALGATITTFLPFFIYFFFVHQSLKGATYRRAAFIFFAAFFVAFWWIRSDQISEVATWVYAGSLGAILISIIFDKQIRSWWILKDVNKFLTGAHQQSIARLQAEYLNLISVNTPAAEARRTHIEDRLKKLGGNIP